MSYPIPKSYVKAHKAIKAIKGWKQRRLENPNGYVLGTYDDVKPCDKQVALVNPSVENVVRIIAMKADYKPYSANEPSILSAFDAANTFIEIGWMTAKNQFPHMDGVVRSKLIQRNVHSQGLLRYCLNAYLETEMGGCPLAFSNEADFELTPHRVPIIMPLEALYTTVELYLGVSSKGGALIVENAKKRAEKAEAGRG